MRTRIVAAVMGIGVLVGGCAGASPARAPVARRPPAAHHFAWIDMLSSKAGWALGDDRVTVYRTSNGVRWTASETTRHVPRSAYGSILYAVSAQEAWYAFTVNGSRIGLYHTLDGGRHWNYHKIPFTYIPGLQGSDPLGGPVAMSFVTSEDGWLLAAPEHGMSTEPGVLYRTRDGGRTWRVVASTYARGGTPSLPFSGDISFSGVREGWLVGSQTSTAPSLIYRTTDGGEYWHEVSFPSTRVLSHEAMSAVSTPLFCEAQGATAIAFRGTGSTVIYETRNSGDSWQFAYASTTPDPAAYQIVDIVRAGPKILAVTYDSEFNSISYVEGNDWSASTWTLSGRIPQRFLPTGARVSELDFVSPMIGWVIITRTGHLPSVLRTGDGGKTWSTI